MRHSTFLALSSVIGPVTGDVFAGGVCGGGEVVVRCGDGDPGTRVDVVEGLAFMVSVRCVFVETIDILVSMDCTSVPIHRAMVCLVPTLLERDSQYLCVYLYIFNPKLKIKL